MEPELETRRLHPATLLFDVGRRFASVALWAVTALFFAARSEEPWYLLLFLPPVVEALVRYVTFRYAFGHEQLVIRSGLLVRGVRHVPYGRIQNIDTVQGPLHRLLGVVEVRLETAAGSAPEAVFRVITGAQLAELRARVFGASAPARSADDAFTREQPFFRMSDGEVLLFGLLSQRGLVLAGGVLVALRELVPEEQLEQRVGIGLELVSREAGELGAWSWLVLAVLVLGLLQLGSIVWAVLTLHGFRIQRVGEDLRTTCGLFTRQSASLPRSRVQFLEARQGPAQRLLARVSLRALSAGADSTRESQVTRKWLVPSCRRRELAAILAEVQPEAGFEGAHWHAVHPRAWRRLFVRWTLRLQMLALALGLVAWWLGLAAAVLGLGLAYVFARVRARELAWAFGARAVLLRDGLFARRQACVRFEKIQSVRLAQSPFDRRARMARLSIDTAGAAGSSLRFEVPYLGLGVARRLARRLQAAAAATDFRW